MKLIGIFTTAAITSIVLVTGGVVAFAAGAFMGMSIGEDKQRGQSTVAYLKNRKES